MKKKDLHTLIHSLTPTEKKFFKEYAQKGKAEKNYIRLFDAIAAQEVYNGEQLKSHFRSEKFTNNFHVLKAYLYELILEALRHMPVHQSTISRYYSLMSEALLLFNKNLFDQALGRLEKAREICNRMDWPLQKMEVSLLQLRILNRKDLVFAGKYFSEVCYPELAELNKELSQLIEIRYLHKQISYAANAKGRFRTPEDEKQVMLLLDRKLINNPEELKSFDTIFAYYSIKAYFYWLGNDFVNAFAFEEKKWLLYKNFPDRLNENVQDVATLLYNLTQISFLKYWDEKALHYLKALENLPASTKNERLFIRNKYVRARLVQLRAADTTQQKKLLSLLETTLKDLQAILPQLDELERLRSLYEAIVVLMRFEKYSEAIDHIQTFLNEKNVEALRPIHYPFVRIFELICHFELGNSEILLSMINNTTYALKKKHRFYIFEQIFISYFKKLVNANRQEQKRLIADMNHQLATLAVSDYEKNGLTFLSQILWLERHTL